MSISRAICSSERLFSRMLPQISRILRPLLTITVDQQSLFSHLNRTFSNIQTAIDSRREIKHRRSQANHQRGASEGERR